MKSNVEQEAQTNAVASDTSAKTPKIPKPPKLNKDGTPRKERVSALSKAQADLAKLEDKQIEINEQIAALREKCYALYIKSDSDTRNKALGISEKK